DLKIGDRIREVRQRQGMTLKALATRVETSAARLSQIENDRLALEVGEILSFAEALGIPLDTLIPPDLTLPYQVVRDADLRTRPGPRARVRAPRGGARVLSPHGFGRLADLFAGRHLEPLIGYISPAAAEDLQFCYHDEEEFAFVLRGRVEFRLK